MFSTDILRQRVIAIQGQANLIKEYLHLYYRKIGKIYHRATFQVHRAFSAFNPGLCISRHLFVVDELTLCRQNEESKKGDYNTFQEALICHIMVRGYG